MLRPVSRDDPCNARHRQEFDNESTTKSWLHRLLSGKAVSARDNERNNVCDVTVRVSVLIERMEREADSRITDESSLTNHVQT